MPYNGLYYLVSSQIKGLNIYFVSMNDSIFIGTITHKGGLLVLEPILINYSPKCQ